MSGGYFRHTDSHISIIADDIQHAIETNEDDVHFCYECGILELSESHDLDPIATDKFWHDKFQKPGLVNEEFNPTDIH